MWSKALFYILYGLNILKMVIVMKTSIVEKQVDALIKGGYYPNRAEFVEDASVNLESCGASGIKEKGFL
jgi:hypothetical protein